jgi:hypothetical protein
LTGFHDKPKHLIFVLAGNLLRTPEFILIECFLPIAFLARDILSEYLALNIKPQIRKGRSRAFWFKLMAAEIYACINRTISP